MTQDEAKLLPCPFCGCNEPELQAAGFGEPEWRHYTCQRCAASTGACSDEKAAAKAWNTRAPTHADTVLASLIEQERSGHMRQSIEEQARGR